MKIYVMTKYDAARFEQSDILVRILLAFACRDITRGSINHAGHLDPYGFVSESTQ